MGPLRPDLYRCRRYGTLLSDSPGKRDSGKGPGGLHSDFGRQGPGAQGYRHDGPHPRRPRGADYVRAEAGALARGNEAEPRPFPLGEKEIAYGKISGAVGTYANIDPFVEKYVCEQLGLEPAPISTQTLQRDRHAEYMATLALIATSLDKFATEIRGLQKSEMREVEEAFAKGQKGSSAMPHKRNPIGCENISGLARVIRGHMLSAYENVPLWHERDISHSSVERVILPDATQLLNYMLRRFMNIVKNLTVFPENMKRNMDRTFGLIYSQQVMLKLIEKGMSREQAYDTVQPRAMQAWEEQRSFRAILEEDETVTSTLSKEELDDCFDYRYHLKHVDTIFQRLGLI